MLDTLDVCVKDCGPQRNGEIRQFRNWGVGGNFLPKVKEILIKILSFIFKVDILISYTIIILLMLVV